MPIVTSVCRRSCPSMRRNTTTCRTTPRSGGDDESHDEAEQPRSGRIDRHVAEIAAEQIDRAMREIDVAHQAEDQREPAGDEEIEPAERDPVEDRVEKKLLLAEDRLEARRPWCEDEPDQARPQRSAMMSDQTGCARRSGSSAVALVAPERLNRVRWRRVSREDDTAFAPFVRWSAAASVTGPGA